MWSVEYIAPLFTILGVLLGGGISYFSSTKLKQMEIKQANIRYELESKRKLYVDFLAEANYVAVSSIEKKNSIPGVVEKLSRLLAEIELVCGMDTHRKATELVGCILDMHRQIPENNKKFSELRAQFVISAKKELPSIEKQT